MAPTNERAEAIHQRISECQRNMESRLERIEADMIRLWERVDRLPAWASILFSVLTAGLGAGLGYMFRVVAG